MHYSDSIRVAKRGVRHHVTSCDITTCDHYTMCLKWKFGSLVPRPFHHTHKEVGSGKNRQVLLATAGMSAAPILVCVLLCDYSFETLSLMLSTQARDLESKK